MRVSREQDWNLLIAESERVERTAQLVSFVVVWSETAEAKLDEGLGHNPYSALMYVLPDVAVDFVQSERDFNLLGTSLLLITAYWEPVASNPQDFIDRMSLIEKAYLNSLSVAWVQAQAQMETLQAQAREFAENNSVG